MAKPNPSRTSSPATAEPGSSGRAFSRTPLTRQHVIDLVQRTLQPLPFVHAMWEGGSTAFARADALSDVDLQVCVDDDKVAQTFAALEAELEKVLGIEAVFAVPEPAWHGHAQKFYRFVGREPWLMLDFCVQKRGNERRFLEPEIHGTAPFLFDKIGLAATITPLDTEAMEKKLRGRIELLRTRTHLLAHLVEKECRRQRVLDAIHFYHGLIIAPLVELLRIRHDPWRHDFGMRYLHTTLPVDQARRLEDLLFLRNFPDLQTKQRVALRWFTDLAAELSRAPKLVYTSGGTVPPRRGRK